MLLRTLYDEKLAQASYLLGCPATGEAMVVDPNRDVEQYVRLAAREGLRITHVTETHIHADFVSGTRELAHCTGSRMYLSAEGGPDWQYGFATSDDAELVTDGDIIQVGNVRVQVMHTPGHTPEHISFVVTDARVAEQPMGVFTGDFVFVGDVGRPDLLEKAAGIANTMRDGARALYRSIERFRELADYIQVWPGHGAGSACGKALGAVPQTTVGYEKLFSPAFAMSSEEEFIDYILAGQPEPPKYFAQMKRINRAGPALINGFRVPAKREAQEIAKLIDDGAFVVDTRSATTFARAHIPGTVNIPFNRAFPNWAGWLIPYDRPFALIVDDGTVARLHEVVRDLALIGLDEIAGYFTADVVDWWSANRGGTQTLTAVTTAQIPELGAESFVLDVRGRSEWDAGHIPGVPNIPVGLLADRQDEIPRDRQIVVHCQSGSRSAIAASVLQSLGFNVRNVRGGWVEWEASGRPVEHASDQALAQDVHV